MEISGERILVTGGEGFIGHHLISRLDQTGAEVHSIGNGSAGSPGRLPATVTHHDEDIRGPSISDTIQQIGPDIVVHLAAKHFVPFCRENPGVAWETNVGGTRNVLEALGPGSPKRLVFASSGAVYTPSDEPHSEDAECKPNDIYGQTKLVGEDLVDLHTGRTFDTGLCARLFNVYGSGETNPHLIPDIIDQLESGTISLGNLSPERDFVHVRDVCDALLALLTASQKGFRRYNVGTGKSHSVRDVAEEVVRVAGTDDEIVQSSDRIRESERQRLCADVARIREELGWTPDFNLETGLRDLLASQR